VIHEMDAYPERTIRRHVASLQAELAVSILLLPAGNATATMSRSASACRCRSSCTGPCGHASGAIELNNLAVVSPK